ncbi:MAG: VPLPA-CTERM sorting domain-containing protein [Paracoccaceae bacterium]
MSLKMLAMAALLSLTSAGASYAATFNFSFDNVEGNVAGTLTGQIFGLQDNTSGQAATQLIIDTFPSGLGNSPSGAVDFVNDFGTTINNSFDVSNGEITSALFAIQSSTNGVLLTFVLNRGFITNCCGRLTNGLTFDNVDSILANSGGFSGVTYEAVAAVPLPAGGLFLLTGFAGIAALKRRKKHTA